MKSKSKIILPIILIVVIAVISIFFGSFLFSTGANFISVDEVDMVSNSPFFSGEKVWNIVASTYGSISQELEFTQTPIADNTGDEAVDSISFSIDIPKKECVYVLNQQPDMIPLVHKKLHTWFCLLPVSSEKAAEKAIEQSDYFNIFMSSYVPGGVADVYGKFIGIGTTCGVTYNTHEYKSGLFTEYFLDYEADVCLTIGTQKKCGKISPNQQTVFLPSGKATPQYNDYAYIGLSGYLSEGRSCENEISMPYVGVYKSGWHIASEREYSYYENAIMGKPFKLTRSNVESWVDKINIQESRVLSTMDRSDITDSTSSEAYYHTDADDRGLTPEFHIVIKADKLKVKTKVPIPEIISVEQKHITEAGTMGSIIVKVKNTGEKGVIHLSAECNNDDFVVFPVKETVYEGDTDTVYLDYQGDTSILSESSDCILTAYSVGGEDTQDFSLIIKGIQSCNPGSKACAIHIDSGLHYVAGCNDEGTGREEIETCDVDEFCENGVCKSKVNPPGPSSEDSEFTMVGLVIGLLAGFGILLLILTNTRFMKKNQGMNILRWILSIVGGIIVTFIVYKVVQGVIHFFTTLKFW